MKIRKSVSIGPEKIYMFTPDKVNKGHYRLSNIIESDIPVKTLTIECNPLLNPSELSIGQYVDFLRKVNASQSHIDWALSQSVSNFSALWTHYRDPGTMMWVLDRFDLEGANCSKDRVVSCCADILDHFHNSMAKKDEPLSFVHTIRQFLDLAIELDDFVETLETVFNCKVANKSTYRKSPSNLTYAKYLFFSATETLMEYAIADFVDYRTDNICLRSVVANIIDAFAYYTRHRSSVTCIDVYARHVAKRNIASIIRNNFTF
jgi:hypothetical protein